MSGLHDIIKYIEKNGVFGLNPQMLAMSPKLREALETLQNAKKQADEEQDQIRKEWFIRNQKEKEQKERALREEREKAEIARKEHVKEVTSMELSLDWENAYADDPEIEEFKTESIPDAFIKCLRQKMSVDIEYIAALSGKTPQEVIAVLQDSIYQNPNTWNECFYKGWETADEYLSGNIRVKLKEAMEADKAYDGYFSRNIKALKGVMPATVCSDNIYATLGSPWIPADYISDFIRYLMKTRYGWSGVKHDELTGTWEFDFDAHNIYRMPYEVRAKYGTDKMNIFEIMLKTLNLQQIVVYKEKIEKGVTKKIVDQTETVAAQEKQKLLKKAFTDWLWSDPNRKRSLEDIYNEKYGSIKLRHYDGSFLEFPEKNPEISLYKYQKDSIARIILSSNTLLAHEVGSGKTFIMIAAGMEMRRLGISKKNLYVVPNNIVGQWRRLFYTLYPDAYVLYIDPKEFTPKTQEAYLQKIRFDDYDAIIMAYSSFTKIPISNKCRYEMLNEEEAKYAEASSDNKRNTAKVNRRKYKIRKELQAIPLPVLNVPQSRLFLGGEERNLVETETGPFFDELGITRLFVDEAHNFKNVPVDTQIKNVMGINKEGSKKCKDMMDKVRIVQMQNEGKGVIMATGTPITNSITDAFVMQSYLQSGQLELLGLSSFDGWIGMFAEKETKFEIDVDTTNYRMAERFAQFHNIPELTNILAQVTDFHHTDAGNSIPEHDGYEDVVIHKTAAFSSYLNQISHRADAVRSGRVKRTEDNMLLITTDGRKAALDMRLVERATPFTVACKVFECAQKVAEIYKQTAYERSTQLIFCDTSTPKQGFNMYDELKNLLVKMGVESSEITFIHDVTTDSAREKLFERVRIGAVRILIGSTFKLGMGVNVQNKLIALHHLDVPWRPADMIQREGRILRQGNENPKVQIFRYITEGSFDAYSWQLLETKQRFITDILSGTVEDRNGADIDDTVLDYAEVKALAVGNPLIKKRVEVANELSRFLMLQRKAETQAEINQHDLVETESRIKIIKDMMPQVRDDADFFAANIWSYTRDELTALRNEIYKETYRKEPEREDKLIAEYRGFSITVPKAAYTNNPVVTITRSGRYQVRIINRNTRALENIDKCIAELDLRYADMEKAVNDGAVKIEYLENELTNGKDYKKEIEEKRIELAEIDEKLNVNK